MVACIHPSIHDSFLLILSALLSSSHARSTGLKLLPFPPFLNRTHLFSTFFILFYLISSHVVKKIFATTRPRPHLLLQFNSPKSLNSTPTDHPLHPPYHLISSHLLVKAVRNGSIQRFNEVVAKYGPAFKADKNHTLVQRLGHNVLKTGN